MVFCNKYSNMSSYKHLLTLMMGGELSFRIYSRSTWSPDRLPFSKPKVNWLLHALPTN